MSFVHLHRHSEYSLLDGTGTAPQYAALAAALGQESLAITDHGTLAGALHHYEACNDVGVKPILGMEAYFKPNRHLKDNDNKKYYHLVLHAKNLKGWRNLMHLSSEAYKSGFYYKPCVDFDLLDMYGEGLICSTACVSSFLNQSILRGDDKGVNLVLDQLQDIFDDDLFIELMPHDFDDQRLLNIELVNLSNERGIPFIATIDAHYPYKEWADTQDILLMIATGQSFLKRKKKKEAGEDLYTFDCDTLYLMSEEEVFDTFKKYHPDLTFDVVREAVVNTQYLADQVERLEISKAPKRPKFDGDSEKTVLGWCREGMVRIQKVDDPVYEGRLEYELDVLRKNNAIDYFAIVGDICRYANSNSIRLGAGRGSAAGCLVSYLIGITQLDPISHGLLFERFLNPDRNEAPDIDLDFQSDKRELVKQYVATKYGVDHVADIGSHQTFKPRTTIQKVSRVFDLHKEAFVVTDTIDALERKPLEDLRKLNPVLDEYAKKYPEPWHHAIRLQGQVHTKSKHAGGVVITDKPIYDYMPTETGKSGETLTQWSASAEFNIIGEYGFDKIDFLGISGLQMQEYACDLIEKRTGERLKLNELEVLKDPWAVEQEVLDGFNKGFVLGVFQFTGSSGFARLIKSIQANWLGDIGAANAIYRPGPLGADVDKSYAERKFGREKVSYFHESVEATLKETYGLIIYQEQIMELVKQMAGFTGGEADNFRKAVSKEYRLGLEHVRQFLEDKGYKEKFWQGCRDRGISEVIAEEVWRNILAFGDYGFNKSHAYCYAVQAYQDMYLKVKYPTEFYAALLTFDPDLSPKVLREARKFNVEIKSPDINKSSFGFTVDDGAIRYGLKAVKNLGDKGVKSILENQPFRSIDDFLEKIPPRACNSRARESLVKAGAFDSFGARSDWNPIEISEGEKESIGISVSDSSVMKKYSTLVNQYITKEVTVSRMDNGAPVVAAGEIVEVKEWKSRSGPMAFFTVEYEDSTWSCTAFTDVWTDNTDLIEVGKPVILRGRKNVYKDKESIVVDAICHIEELAMEINNGDN